MRDHPILFRSTAEIHSTRAGTNRPSRRRVRGAGGFHGVLALGAALSLAAAAARGGESIRLHRVEATPVRFQTNLLANPGFEATEGAGTLAGWLWDRRNTDAECRIDRAVFHDGRQSIRITNGTGFGPHVYGMLWQRQPVRLVAGQSYTLSAWVNSSDPGLLTLMGGAGWQFRTQAIHRDGQWHRIWKTFSPGTADLDFTVRLSTESPTAGVWVDDVKLEAGETPTPDPARPGEDTRILLEPDEPETVIQSDGPFQVAFLLRNPQPFAGHWSARFGAGEALRAPANLAAGLWRVAVNGEAIAAADAPRTLTLGLDGQATAGISAKASVRFYSASNALTRLTVLKAALPALESRLAALQARGLDTAYPRVSATVLRNFIAYAELDAQRGEVRRALEQVGDLEAIAGRLSQALNAAAADPLGSAPRWTGESRPTIQSSSFRGLARRPGEPPAERPIFFNGYGHFGQVVSDLEKWPDYGINIIQIELGPSSVFPAEGQTNMGPVRRLQQTLDRAQKAGVAVCLLISPHYLPGWALEKWPHLRKRREGFLQYCLHAPEGQELLQRFLRIAIEPLKDHPALHSVCLSNEPVNQEEPCDAGRALWWTWLARRHGTIEALNARCGSHVARFADLPLPDPFGPRPAPGVWMDFVRFNQEFFADWHQRMADAIHAVAPGLPVHAKAMTWTMVNDGDVRFGVDATLFGRFSQINGNDAVNWFSFGREEFAQGWVQNALGHDLQRSVLDAPVFNTENHLIVDRETRYVPAAHIRAALWQAAIHGQSASTIWVWERTFDAKSDFAGSIMHRPACAEAVGVITHDLNRAALEVTALQQARPHVVLLQSATASVWDGGRSSDCLYQVYTALSFTGLKLGFITERQLESGRVPEAPVVIVPGMVHLSAQAAAQLAKFSGRLLGVGELDLLSRDEYGRPLNTKLAIERIPFCHGTTSARNLHRPLLDQLRAWSLKPALDVCGADAQPVWGVEWRTAETRDGLLVNCCNYGRAPAQVRLVRSPEGADVAADDLLSGRPVNGPLSLTPLEVRLLRVRGSR